LKCRADDGGVGGIGHIVGIGAILEINLAIASVFIA
jgi:hypothetical protein